VVLGLLFLMLSFSQLVLFLTLGGALLAQELFSEEPREGSVAGRILGGGFSPRRALGLAGALAGATLVASRLGGFFAPAADASGPGLVVHLGVAETLWGNLKWFIATYGVLLPLGLAGLALLPRLRVLFASLLAGCFAIICTFRVQGSWDIVKFATAAAIGLSILAGVTLGRLWSRAPRRVFRPLTAALAGLSVAGGVSYAVVFGLDLEGIPRMYHKKAAPLAGADEVAVSWLRRQIKAGEHVYRRQGAAGYALWGGLPQVWVDKNVPVFGFSAARIQRRKQLLSQLPPEPDAYLAQGIRWLVLDSGDAALRKHAEAWIQAGRAREALSPRGLLVVEIR
jgi:hypothetical protein